MSTKQAVFKWFIPSLIAAIALFIMWPSLIGRSQRSREMQYVQSLSRSLGGRDDKPSFLKWQNGGGWVDNKLVFIFPTDESEESFAEQVQRAVQIQAPSVCQPTAHVRQGQSSIFLQDNAPLDYTDFIQYYFTDEHGGQELTMMGEPATAKVREWVIEGRERLCFSIYYLKPDDSQAVWRYGQRELSGTLGAIALSW